MTMPVGRQGGIEIIQHGERLATCGFLFAEGPKGHGFSELKQRTVRSEGSDAPCVEVLAGIPGTDMTYRALLKPEGDSIRLSIVVEKSLASAGITSARFDIALYPPDLWGKSFVCGDTAGVFTRAFGQVVSTNTGGGLSVPPLGKGSSVTIVPEDPLLTVAFRSLSGEMRLVDERRHSEGGWFHLVSDVAVDRTGEVLDMADHAGAGRGVEAAADDCGFAGGLSPGTGEAGGDRA